MKAEVFIGVDVCKPRLDVTVLPTGEILEFENTLKGTKQFVKCAKKLKPTLIACGIHRWSRATPADRLC